MEIYYLSHFFGESMYNFKNSSILQRSLVVRLSFWKEPFDFFGRILIDRILQVLHCVERSCQSVYTTSSTVFVFSKTLKGLREAESPETPNYFHENNEYVCKT